MSAAIIKILLHSHKLHLKTLNPIRRQLCSVNNDPIRLLTEKRSTVTSDGDIENLKAKISSLAREILSVSDVKDVAGVLESRSAVDLLRKSRNGFVSVELLSKLRDKTDFALEVFNWRRKQVDEGIPMLAEEYSKAITLAARSKNINLCVALFHEAFQTHCIRNTCLYNALMSAYMYNGYTKKAISTFEDLKKDPNCNPSIVTYNMLLSVFGRSMLIKHMESTLKTVEESDDIKPNATTYNNVIAGYVTAWKWDKMENTFYRMESGHVKPNLNTYSLMLRGYAHSVNIEKMERTYEILKKIVSDVELNLIHAMVWAYCESSDSDRVTKIEKLLKLVWHEEYRPWLNVLLIRLYAQEGLVDSMDRFILEAFRRKTLVTTAGIMRTIISSYYECDAVDRLSNFIQHAEFAGWRLCRSLYHCKMVMYGQRHQLEEMHLVLDEMEDHKLDPTKKTFLIMIKAYWKLGRNSEAQSIFGIMWKHGFCSPEDSLII